MKIQTMPISFNSKTDLKSFTIKTLVALIIMILIFIIFTALFFVFVERVIVIWINIILSPVGVLFWVLKSINSNLDAGGGDDGVLGLGKFMKMVFLPATVGIPLVFGVMMVSVGKRISADKAQAIKDGTHVNKDTVDMTGLIDGVTDTQELLWYVLTIGIIWSSIKIAENAANYTKGAITGIKDGVNSFANFMVKLPMYAPWIPVKTGKGNDTDKKSLMNLIYTGRNIKSGMEQKASQGAFFQNSANGDSNAFRSKHQIIAQDIETLDSSKINALLEEITKNKGKIQSDAVAAAGLSQHSNTLTGLDKAGKLDLIKFLETQKDVNSGKISSARNEVTKLSDDSGGKAGDITINVTSGNGTVNYAGIEYTVTSRDVVKGNELWGKLNNESVEEIANVLENLHKSGVDVSKLIGDNAKTVREEKVTFDNVSGSATITK